MKDRPFKLIGVNSDDVETAKKAVAANRLNWRSFRNERKGAAAVSDEWCIAGWPTIVVLDEELRIHYRGHDGDEATRVAKRLVGALESARRER